MEKELGTSPNGDYTFVELDPLGADGNPTTRMTEWLRATGEGFHGPSFDDKEIAQRLKNRLEDGRRFLAAYPTGPRPEHVSQDSAAATFSTMDGTVSFGADNLLEANLITSVTVRTSDRRRGLLSSFMRADLQRTVDRGQPIALLTASEATIYRRFGFGQATYNHAITLETPHGLPLKREIPGTVHSVEPDVLFDLSQHIFEQFHAQTNGSVSRSISYPLAISGRITEESSLERNKKARGAVYYDGDARPAGYVAYEVAGSDEWPVTLKVGDLVALTEDAYLALWKHMGTIDLSKKVTFSEAPVQDPLPYALADSRQYQVTGREDLLWARVLDVKTVLEARTWTREGQFALTIDDPLNHASGSYLVDVSGGRAHVTVSEDDQVSNAVVLHVADLGTLAFGGVDPVTRSSGMLMHRSNGAPLDQAARWDVAAWFRQPAEPYCLTHF